MRKFWAFTQERDARRLRLEGEISQETWLGDEVTPAAFRAELFAGTGDLVVAVNSPGGDVFAAAQIYDMLMEYPGKVTVYIDGLAASAASVIAMAGEEVVISPVSCIMIHNPSTLAIGDGEEMLRAKAMLDEVKESIINAYEIRTGLSRVKLGHLMDAETWMNARKAVELGFADRVGSPVEFVDDTPEPMIFSRAAVTASLLTSLGSFCPCGQKLTRSVTAPFPTEPAGSAGAHESLSKIPKQKPVPEGTSITAAYERLNLFNGGSTT